MNKFMILIFISTISMLYPFPVFSETNIPALTPQKALTGKWGYVDGKGCYRISPIFESAMPFKEGLAVVSVCKKFAFIDEKGRPVIKPQYDEARSFSGNLAAVMIYDQESNKKWGFINKTGKLVIEPKYDEVSDFSGWTAMVKINGKTFIINSTGEIIYDDTQ
jgi:hypothetical protein